MVRRATTRAQLDAGSMPLSQAGSLPLSDGIRIVPHDVQERIRRRVVVYLCGSATQLPEIRRHIHTYINGVEIVTSVM